MSSRRILLAMSIALLPAQAAHAARLQYTAELRVERNDNLFLQAVDPQEATVLRPGVDFVLSEESSILRLALSGRLRYYDFSRVQADSTLEGLVEGRLDWQVVPERLVLAVQDSLSMQPIDTLAPDIPGNRQRVNVFSAGPTLLFRPGPATEGSIDLRYVDTHAEVNDDFNSSRLGLAARLLRELTPTDTLGAHAQWESVRFDNEGGAQDYHRGDLFLRYQHRAARYSIVADAGVTRLDYRGARTNRRNPLLRLEGNWFPSPEHRFTVRWSREYSDVAAWALQRLDGQIRPGNGMSLDMVVANASPFIVRQAEVEYMFGRERWELRLAPYVNRIRYVGGSNFDRDGSGYSLDVGFMARERLRFGVGSARDHDRFVTMDRDTDVRRNTAYVEYSFNRHWRSRFEVGRHTRRDSVFPGTQEQGIVALTIAYSNF